jgi:hypothetical protein
MVRGAKTGAGKSVHLEGYENGAAGLFQTSRFPIFKSVVLWGVGKRQTTTLRWLLFRENDPKTNRLQGFSRISLSTG